MLEMSFQKDLTDVYHWLEELEEWVRVCVHIWEREEGGREHKCKRLENRNFT